MWRLMCSPRVDHGFKPRLSQTKGYTFGICCFFTKHAALSSKSKDWLARNQNNVSKWSDMSTSELLFQWANTIKIQLSTLVSYKADIIIISLKYKLFSPWYNWKIVLTMIQLKNCYHHDTTEKKFLTMIQLKNCSLTILLKKNKKKIYIYFSDI